MGVEGIGLAGTANDCNVFLASMTCPSGNVYDRNGMVLLPLLVFDVVEGFVVVVVVGVDIKVVDREVSITVAFGIFSGLRLVN
jgi:hypothetical protein